MYVGGDRITGSPFTALSYRGNAAAASGSQWTILVNAGATSTAPHADTRDMAFRADGTLLESDDGGMYRHTNPSGTGSWVAAAGNIQAIEAHNVAYNTLNNTLVIGTQDNGTHLQPTAGNTQWTFINGGDGGDVAVDSVTLAGSNRSIVYLSSQNLGGFRRVVYDSNNNFVSSTTLATISGVTFTTPIELNTINPQRLLIGGASALFESMDQGTTNANIAGPGQPGFLQNAMVYGGSQGGTPNPDLIYVGANSTVYKRTTSGGSITATTALPTGASQIYDVAIDPDNYDTVFASDNNQVFMSSNGGSTWSDITGNLTSVSSTEFRTMEYVPGNIVDAITVGTRSGVFFALMSAPTVWKKLSTGLPDVAVFDMEYVPSQDVLVAGTFGRSVWTLPVASQEFFSTDFGDAPNTYGTLLSNNGPRHLVVPGLKLGANTDTEADATPNVRALGDDTIGVSDDEDGIIQPTTDLVMTIGTAPTITLRATNTTGLAATLYGWIDYNNDGQFQNATERASISVPTGTNNGLVTLTFPTVPGGFTGTTYARFRLSTDGAAASPTGAASNGEVEDYVATILSASDSTANSSRTVKIAHNLGGGPTMTGADRFGTSVAAIGDLNGDGVTDMVVGAERDSVAGTNRGAVYLMLMNSDGTVQSSVKVGDGAGGGPTLANGDFFGHAVAGLGDLDGDGVGDIAVGAYGDNTGGSNRGAVYVFLLNADRSIKSTTKIANSTGGGARHWRTTIILERRSRRSVT